MDSAQVEMMRDAGLSEVEIAAAWGVDLNADTDFELYEENEPAARVFVACQTQWRMLVGAAACMRVGLEYASVAAVMDLYSVTDRRQCFDGVRVIEAEFLRLDSDKKRE